MDTTDCLGLPYPECDPPLVKDASDIEQFRDLAVATDTAVQALADSISETLLNPDAVCMVGGVNTAGQDVVHFYSGTPKFDNAGMADTIADGIRIQEDGWYMIGGWVQMLASGAFLRVEPLLNGDVFTSRQGPAHTVSTSETVTWTDVGYFQTGDLITAMSHHVGNPVTVFTYATEIWALQVLADV